jgi:NitT/TauT family transport system substrate-binding protein
MKSACLAMVGLLALSGTFARVAWGGEEAQPAGNSTLPTIVVSAPGPRNLSYLPVDLIPRIGADSAEGVRLQILHTGGGAVALNNLVTRNADFAVAGVPAAMSLRAGGGDVVVVAPVDDIAVFVLMVRSELKGKVKTIADLKGRVIAVNTSTRSSKTTSQQLAEILLNSGGVNIDQVRIVPGGQRWEEQSSLMVSGAADAVMGDEPFATRMLAAGQVFFLANLAREEDRKVIPGAGFLHAALETRSEIIKTAPAKVDKMVRMVKRSLAWLATHTPEQIADALGITDPQERGPLVQVLKANSTVFSRDGQFSTAQLIETDLFFSAGAATGAPVKVESIVNDHWAGRKP